MNLEECRKEIEAIDTELQTLFEKRMDVAARIGEIKRKNGMAVLDASREAALLEKVRRRSRPELAGAAEELFLTLFSLSRHHQESKADGVGGSGGASRVSRA